MTDTKPESQSSGAAEERVAAPTARGAERTHTRPVYAPRTDIYETEAGLVLLVDLPGARPETTDVMLEQGVLTIRARSADRAPAGFSPVYQEYEPGDFERAFTLSEEVDAGAIEAQVKDGVLRLFLPRAKARTQRVEVRAG